MVDYMSGKIGPHAHLTGQSLGYSIRQELPKVVDVCLNILLLSKTLLHVLLIPFLCSQKTFCTSRWSHNFCLPSSTLLRLTKFSRQKIVITPQKIVCCSVGTLSRIQPGHKNLFTVDTFSCIVHIDYLTTYLPMFQPLSVQCYKTVLWLLPFARNEGAYFCHVSSTYLMRIGI